MWLKNDFYFFLIIEKRKEIERNLCLSAESRAQFFCQSMMLYCYKSECYWHSGSSFITDLFSSVQIHFFVYPHRTHPHTYVTYTGKTVIIIVTMLNQAQITTFHRYYKIKFDTIILYYDAIFNQWVQDLAMPLFEGLVQLMVHTLSQ